MTKRILLLTLVPVAALVWWAIHQKSQPPEITFTTAHRETLISNLITNGKAEPVSWQDIRVDNQGLVTQVPVKEGQTRRQGRAAGAVERARTEPRNCAPPKPARNRRAPLSRP